MGIGFYRNRTAVITGGGRGFGKAFGVALAAEGAHGVLVDINGADAEAAATQIRANGGAATGVEFRSVLRVADSRHHAGYIGGC